MWVSSTSSKIFFPYFFMKKVKLGKQNWDYIFLKGMCAQKKYGGDDRGDDCWSKKIFKTIVYVCVCICVHVCIYMYTNICKNTWGLIKLSKGLGGWEIPLLDSSEFIFCFLLFLFAEKYLIKLWIFTPALLQYIHLYAIHVRGLI